MRPPANAHASFAIVCSPPPPHGPFSPFQLVPVPPLLQQHQLARAAPPALASWERANPRAQPYRHRWRRARRAARVPPPRGRPPDRASWIRALHRRTADNAAVQEQRRQACRTGHLALAETARRSRRPQHARHRPWPHLLQVVCQALKLPQALRSPPLVMQPPHHRMQLRPLGDDTGQLRLLLAARGAAAAGEGARVKAEEVPVQFVVARLQFRWQWCQQYQPRL